MSVIKLSYFEYYEHKLFPFLHYLLSEKYFLMLSSYYENINIAGSLSNLKFIVFEF